MTALRDITAEQQDQVDEILKRYGQTEETSELTYQRKTHRNVDGTKTQRKTGSVILSFNAEGKTTIKGVFHHQFTIRDDGSYTSKANYKGV